MSKALSLIALACVAPLAAGDAANPVEALKSGKATLEIRTRYEHVDNQAIQKTADALTSRFALGYTSGSWQGLSFTAQFENVAVLGEPRFQVPAANTPGGYGRTVHAVVVDPPVTQVNQFYLEFKGFKVGRQLLNLDNQRFIGSVGWRQNDQAFTGATFTNKTWIPYTEFTLGHFTKAHTIGGVTKDINAEIANLHFTFIPKGHLRAFYYAFEEQLAKTASFAHTGARLDGEVWKMLYDVSFANQRAYKDATSATVKEVGYQYLGLGFKFNANHSVMLAQETLEGGFKTPYATLHAWNGWADNFLATPANGLVDKMVTYKGKLAKFALDAGYHAYEAETNGLKYGTELNLSVSYPVTSWLTVLAKAANYAGDSGAPAPLHKDLKKFWLQTLMKF